MRELSLRRIPMEKIVNFRSLGGYASGKDDITKHGVFYRCGWMAPASDNDIETIKNMGIKTVIDLRSIMEAHKVPNNLSQESEINYLHVDLLQSLNPEELEKIMQGDKPSDFGLVELYKYLVDSTQEKIKILMDEISDAVTKGGVLFHCSAGKDRTGMTAMFLLSIANVDILDIIADYEVSATYIQSHGQDELMGSNPINMIGILEYMKEKYKSPVEYLKTIGISQQQITTIRNAMLS